MSTFPYAGYYPRRESEIDGMNCNAIPFEFLFREFPTLSLDITESRTGRCIRWCGNRHTDSSANLWQNQCSYSPGKVELNQVNETKSRQTEN